MLVHDWTDDSGEPGDRYDPELDALFGEATAGLQLDPVLMQEFVDKLEEKEPAVGRLLVNDPEGIDAILIQFPTYSGDATRTKAIQEDIEALWFGDDDALTATSESIISVTDHGYGCDHGAADRGDHYHHCGGSYRSRRLLLGDGATAGAGDNRGGAYRAGLISVLGTMALLGIPSPGYACRRKGVSNTPIRHICPGMAIELIQLPFQSPA